MAATDPATPHVGESTLGESRIAPEAKLSASPERTFQRRRLSKKIEGAVYINGHPQICTHMASCYYGSVSNNGCSYLVETGKSRIVQGLYIEDGKCPCYKKKGRTRARRQEPLTFTFGVADRRGKDYSEV